MTMTHLLALKGSKIIDKTIIINQNDMRAGRPSQDKASVAVERTPY